MYTVKILKEDDISWEIQNEIHKLLNTTFKGKSTRFIAKTYAHIRPSERIILFREDQPIAHLAIHEDTLHVGSISKRVACLGLWCAANHSKKLATDIMKIAYTHLEKKGFALGFGITSSQVILKYVLPQMRHLQLDVQVKGKNTTSKPIDKTLFLVISMSDEELKAIKKEAVTEKVVYVDTEVF